MDPDLASHPRPDLDSQAVPCPYIQTRTKSKSHHSTRIPHSTNVPAVKHKVENNTGVKDTDIKPRGGDVSNPCCVPPQLCDLRVPLSPHHLNSLHLVGSLWGLHELKHAEHEPAPE